MEWEPSPENIRELRLAIGWTQAELGERLGCSRKTISAFENGHRTPRELECRELKRIQKRYARRRQDG